VEWLYPWPCLVASCCGTRRTIYLKLVFIISRASFYWPKIDLKIQKNLFWINDISWEFLHFVLNTAALVQSCSYSRAVHFHCWAKFVISGWSNPTFWLMCGINQVIFSWLCKFTACVQKMFSIRRREGYKATHCHLKMTYSFVLHRSLSWDLLSASNVCKHAFSSTNLLNRVLGLC